MARIKKLGKDIEYIVPVNEAARDMDEMFIGLIRSHPQLIRCKDCKYFELDHIEEVNSIPLIVSHENCTRWGTGCKTSLDGYCFMAERKENND